MSARCGVAILGSTGSIGRSTLAVIAEHPERFRVTCLGANRSWQALVAQARQFAPDQVILLDEEDVNIAPNTVCCKTVSDARKMLQLELIDWRLAP